MLWILLAAACVLVAGNLLIVTRLLCRRRVSRVSLVLWIGLLVVGCLCVIDALYWEPDWVQMTTHTIETDRLQRGSSIRIVQITDLHLSDRLNLRDTRAMEMAAAARPDVILLTGDYTAKKTAGALSALSTLAKRLCEVAPVYAVEGNWDGPEDVAALKKGGATMLRGWVRFKCRGGGHISIGGADWYDGALDQCRSTLFRVVMCHAPWHLDKFAQRGIDLVLCGHTHGGQVRLPFFGALLPNKQLVGDYQAGMYRLRNTRMYVNRGLGMEGAGAPAIRFWCRPEVAVFDIIGTGSKP